tara:strand:- start:659 stop:1516 length:858 start_codon:yes stop_codon:yes gene_type:complete
MKKVMHFFWPNEPLSWLRFTCLETFIDLNPDWKVILWRRKNVGAAPQWCSDEHKTPRPADLEDWRPNIKNLSLECREVPDDWQWYQQSINTTPLTNVHFKDMWNWTLLKNGEGFVADMDIIWLRSIPEFDTDANTFITVFNGAPLAGYVPVTMMGSTKPNQPPFCDALDRAIAGYNPEHYESCGAPCFNKELLHDHKWYNLGHIVYPIVTKYGAMHGVYKMIHFDMSSDITNEVGLHWYGGHEQSRWFENHINGYNDIKRLRGENREHENTITRLLTKHYELKKG